MRIGIFSDTYPPFINGVSTSVFMLKKALERAGHQVFVVTINTETFHYGYDDEYGYNCCHFLSSNTDAYGL